MPKVNKTYLSENLIIFVNFLFKILSNLRIFGFIFFSLKIHDLFDLFSILIRNKSVIEFINFDKNFILRF